MIIKLIMLNQLKTNNNYGKITMTRLIMIQLTISKYGETNHE
jgi:hypothetical protein